MLEAMSSSRVTKKVSTVKSQENALEEDPEGDG